MSQEKLISIAKKIQELHTSYQVLVLNDQSFESQYNKMNSQNIVLMTKNEYAQHIKAIESLKRNAIDNNIAMFSVVEEFAMVYEQAKLDWCYAQMVRIVDSNITVQLIKIDNEMFWQIREANGISLDRTESWYIYPTAGDYKMGKSPLYLGQRRVDRTMSEI